MRALVEQAQLDPAPRRLITKLVAGARDSITLGWKVRQYIRQRLTLVNEGVELLHLPEWMIAEMMAGRRVFGDCDDAALIAATLLTALGIPSRFVAVKPKGTADFIHVFVELEQEGFWYILDPTSDQVPADMGEFDRMELAV